MWRCPGCISEHLSRHPPPARPPLGSCSFIPALQAGLHVMHCGPGVVRDRVSFGLAVAERIRRRGEESV
ncbi:hypothetical protein E2C01_021440 [Portunus trituberculatus]|uniref:Uncharacterized protein n=1 Tax=Portunus trituberculatus TaxID=210409 RepID=A0A5B7E2I8_PORTR|nr:hypothetical protein [Portunus trituberculatus]